MPGHCRYLFRMSKSRTLNLEKVYQWEREFAREREWEQYHSPKNLVMGLASEVGELVEIFQWLTPGEARDIMGSKAEAVSHEIADVLYYVTRLADVLGIDLESAFWEKMAVNEKKYPVELSRGRAKKYDELKKGDK